MKNERKFCHCPHCGNFVSFIQDAGQPLTCCGEEMDEIRPNTVEASAEKHLPVAVRNGDWLEVTVGSAAHPMSEEHRIEWILAAEQGKTQRVTLDPAGAPFAEFPVGDGPVTVYAYCNQHGLWTAEY
ncbi:MAG: desulfoferrodoxin [Oscillospiraceae bacterium]|jgi:superoxide reductase|nr:desulfoferrodoxin [Oscillospiraceae bacterium]